MDGTTQVVDGHHQRHQRRCGHQRRGERYGDRSGGVNNARAGTPTASGTLSIPTWTTRPPSWRRHDGADLRHVLGHATGGAWSYTLDNGNAAVQALNAGATLTDHITVTTVDGTTQVVTVTINGTNDAAVISGAVSGTVSEAGGVNNASAGTPRPAAR